MEAEPGAMITLGLMMGVIGTLLVQWYGRIRARRAIAENKTALAGDEQAQQKELAALKERITVMERLATDPAERTAREIEILR